MSVIVVVAILVLVSCTPAEQAPGAWDSRNWSVIEELVQTQGARSASYDSAKRPYAVFDWDNTCIFGDCEDTLFMYYINQLLFAYSPEEFAVVLGRDVPAGPMQYQNVSHQTVGSQAFISDIVSDYRFLRANYADFGGKMDLATIQKTPQFVDFRAKLFAMFAAVDKTCGAAAAYLWQGRLLLQMDAVTLRKNAEMSNDFNLQQPLRRETLTSPPELPGEAGVVTVSTDQFLRTQPEMAALFKYLQENGTDVYLCSASPEPIVKLFASQPKYGYALDEDNVIGVRFNETNGKLVADLAPGQVMTWGPGKVEAINSLLIAKKGYGPIMVGGDSDGDYDMLSQIPSVKLGLLINRVKSGKTGELCRIAVAQRNESSPRYFLQGRDENNGIFLPDIATILFSKTETTLVK
ncbi:MAG: HAD family hydrolase [bacterium]